jgi:hypothetical protein
MESKESRISCEEKFWEAIKNSPEIQVVLRRRRIRVTYLS